MINYSVIVDNVSFGYSEQSMVLKNISLKIPAGKIIGLMGGSGSGKTTLLRLLTGQYKPQSGTIRILNNDLNNTSGTKLNSLRKNMGVLFQFGALFTDMSVYENVAFPIKEHTKLPETFIKKIVAMKLNAVGLFGTQELYPHQLSGGMARRVALARSMALDPKLMLYDEPFTGLDPIGVNIAAMLIKKLNTALGQTSILISHDVESTMKIADYIYVIEDGTIIAADAPENVANSSIPYIRQFFYGEVKDIDYAYHANVEYSKYLQEN